ncbi:YpbS family protein [Paenibacillus doosanensis]|uniref:YpbS family protein n=1 Tax=Paenibacillus doosanensis TaxID=1229154 RepID=UPI00217FC181|nr:YpbS family protein [Paenibacillus doosanensis]MCS7460428.1 YpbS family protein [Paenibacillus doosanensis]
MSVHEQITAHTRKMHSHLEAFQRMDDAREAAIEQAVALCASGQAFTTDEINRITARINDHAQRGISPTRPYVTSEMVAAYVQRKLSAQ